MMKGAREQMQWKKRSGGRVEKERKGQRLNILLVASTATKYETCHQYRPKQEGAGTS